MDDSLYRAVNRFVERSAWLHPFATDYAKYGIVLFGVALLVGWWIARGRPDATTLATVACTVVAVFVALGVAQMVSHFVGRDRPYYAITGMRVLVPRASDFSFPSDHATAAGAVAGGLWLVDRRLGWVTIALAVAMAFSRVYVGVHYPSDVLVGLVLGAGVAIGVNRIARRHFARLLTSLARSPLGPLIRSGGDGPGLD